MSAGHPQRDGRLEWRDRLRVCHIHRPRLYRRVGAESGSVDRIQRDRRRRL